MQVYTIPNTEVIRLAADWETISAVIRKVASESAELAKQRRSRLQDLTPLNNSEAKISRWLGRQVAKLRAKLDPRSLEFFLTAKYSADLVSKQQYALEAKTASLAKAAEERGIDPSPFVTFLKSLAAQERAPSGILGVYANEGDSALKAIEMLAARCRFTAHADVGSSADASRCSSIVVPNCEIAVLANGSSDAKQSRTLPPDFVQKAGRPADPLKCRVQAATVRTTILTFDAHTRIYADLMGYFPSYEKRYRKDLRADAKKVWGKVLPDDLERNIEQSFREGKDHGSWYLKALLHSRGEALNLIQITEETLRSCVKTLAAASQERDLNPIPLEVLSDCDWGRHANSTTVAEASRHLLRQLDQFSQEEERKRIARLDTPEPPATNGEIDREFAFINEGDVWRVRYKGKESKVGNVKGMTVIAKLLAQPNSDRPISAYDLDDDLAGLRPIQGQGQDATDHAGLGDLNRQINEVKEEKQKAEKENDFTTIDRAGRELQKLLDSAANIKGLGGKLKQIGDTNSNRSAAEAVNKNLDWAYKKIAKHDPIIELAKHLKDSIKGGTGGFFYRPGPKPPDWHIKLRA